MPLRIGLDLDGVLADMEGELIRQAAILFGKTTAHRLQDHAAQPPQAADVSTNQGATHDPPPLAKLNMTARQQERLWQHVMSIENFWETLQEIEPGMTERLAMTTANRRWEVIFLTKRPETVGATAQLQSQRWLQSKGFALPSVYVVPGSRGRIADALGLDIVIDDRPESCLDVVVDSKARAILVWRDDPEQLPAAARRLGIGVVRSVSECLDILEQVDASHRPGLISRVLRALGLREPIDQTPTS